MAAPLDLAAFLVLAGLAGLGAWLDLRHRLLPNWLCALTLLAGLAFAFAQGGWPAVASGGGHALVALAVGMGLFALGAIGGGGRQILLGSGSMVCYRRRVPAAV